MAPAPPAITRAELQELVTTSVRAAFAEVQAPLVAPSASYFHQVSPSDVRRLGREFSAAAHAISGAQGRWNDAANIKSIRQTIVVATRSRLNFNGKGSRWENLPAHRFVEAVAAIHAYRDEHVRTSRAARPPKEDALSLFDRGSR
jgi:hypothetical protein